MKLNLVAAIAALLPNLVLAVPTPDPNHLEVVIALDDVDVADESTRPSSTTNVLPPTKAQDQSLVTVLFYGQQPNVFPAPSGYILNGTPTPAPTSSIYHIAITGAAASCVFTTNNDQTFEVISRKYSGSKELPYGPYTFKNGVCLPLKKY